MSIFENNLTFAVLVTDGNWRTDLTIRFCEYFSHAYNGENFIRNIIYPKSIDDALETCSTDYLLIQGGGHIPFISHFFYALEKAVSENTDILLGHVELAQDYLLLGSTCMIVNMPLWRAAGKPKFQTQVREGPRFRTLKAAEFKHLPAQIEVDPNPERIFVTNACSIAGAAIIIRQLEMWGKARGLVDVLPPETWHYLDKSSPYHEIHHETLFEKRYLPRVMSKVFAQDPDDLSNIGIATSDIIVACAQGLKAYTLAEHFDAKRVAIYDINPLTVELQRRIFSVKKATLYGDIVREMMEDIPSADVVDGWDADSDVVITPLKTEVSFHIIDAVSYEMEELLLSFDQTSSMIADFSDIFIYPYNFYRRPLYQVQGLFGELYSILKSRQGPTHILGFAPGYQHMDTIEVNTARVQFETKPQTIDEAKVLKAEAEERGEELPAPIPIIYVPTSTAPLPENQLIPLERSTAEAFVPPRIPSPFTVAEELGYEKGRRTELIGEEQVNVVVFTKRQLFEEVEDFEGIYEYLYNEMTGQWSFRIGKVDHDKKIELMNGFDGISLIGHLQKEFKVNPKTAVRYFK